MLLPRLSAGKPLRISLSAFFGCSSTFSYSQSSDCRILFQRVPLVQSFTPRMIKIIILLSLVTRFRTSKSIREGLLKSHLPFKRDYRHFFLFCFKPIDDSDMQSPDLVLRLKVNTPNLRLIIDCKCSTQKKIIYFSNNLTRCNTGRKDQYRVKCFYPVWSSHLLGLSK